MTTIIDVPIHLTAPPASFDPSSSKPGSLSKPLDARLYQVGHAYAAYAQRKLKQRSFDDDDVYQQEEMLKRMKNRDGLGSAGVDDDLGVGDEMESFQLLQSDPKQWKTLDQYAVLGLSHLRYKATDDQIKIAHRKKVLKHHPDKKANAGDSNDDAFFKCIQKAYETMLHPERRRQFDSVDPYYIDLEDEVPTAQDIESDKNPEVAFFTKFAPVFEREAHFCASRPEDEVPKLGSMDDSRETVESFYDFWYNFESWRTFEWHDKEMNEGSNSRDDKRYTEKKNKGERTRRKNEDNARVRGIVDVALSVDPRIKRIKQEDKDRRAKGKAKSGGPQPKLSTKDKAEEASKAKEEAEQKEAEEKAARAAEKKAKEAARREERKKRKEAASGPDGAPAPES